MKTSARTCKSAFYYRFAAIFTAMVILLHIIGNEVYSSELSRTQILELFHQAKDLFRQADQAAGSNPQISESLYRQAAMRYESIVSKGGIENGKLFYNIGNMYFLSKEIGRAILNYRRAEGYIPDDPNLRQNLSYVRNFRHDKIDERQVAKVFKTLFFWHYDLSARIKILLFSVVFCLAWTLGGIRLFFKNFVPIWGFVAAIVLTVMMGGSLVAETITLHRDIPGVIIDPEVIARKGNSDNYAPSFTEPLHAGTEFDLLEKRGNWMNIELPDERTCWIPSKSAELVRN